MKKLFVLFAVMSLSLFACGDGTGDDDSGDDDFNPDDDDTDDDDDSPDYETPDCEKIVDYYYGLCGQKLEYVNPGDCEPPGCELGRTEALESCESGEHSSFWECVLDCYWDDVWGKPEAGQKFACDNFAACVIGCKELWTQD